MKPCDKPSKQPDINHLNPQKSYFKSFHELMTRRVGEILLISSPYDAFIMQEDGRLSERIIHEYQGLNLSRPPRLTWVSNAAEAFTELETMVYDLVIVMPHISDMDAYTLCGKIKQEYDMLPVYYFAYDAGKVLEDEECYDRSIIDGTFVWGGNTDLLLALVKSREDSMNVAHDTDIADVRVVIFVEDSPFYLSSLLPYIYKEIVMQTQAVMDDSLNEKERILRMRTRPKILVAENYEQAWELCERYRQYLMCVISDVRFPRNGREDAGAGIRLLSAIHREIPDMPLLMLSSEPDNQKHAKSIPAFFLDKKSPTLHADIRFFFIHFVGFGDFVFRMPDGRAVARASNLRSLSSILHSVPDESIAYHAARNHFSRWLMARFEMQLAAMLRPMTLDDFSDLRSLKDHLADIIRSRLKIKQRGLITDFVKEEYDPEMDFVKIGKGSLGGKARGLAFMSNLFREKGELRERFKGAFIQLPRVVVITTDGFDAFELLNDTREFRKNDQSDQEIEARFMNTRFPEWLSRDLKAFLRHTNDPLAVRSSAILEDAHYRASAGAYTTYMLPNNHPDIEVRLTQLIRAVKLVYSSVYKETPRVLARHSVYRSEEDKMAVIIQKLVGCRYGDFFYPAISGVAQSYNFYPVQHMRPEEGVAHIAMGLGKIVVDGGVALRFSPQYPELLPQFSTVENILKNAQRYFYALRMRTSTEPYMASPSMELETIDVDDAVDHLPVRQLCSTYFPADGRLRHMFNKKGYPVVTFASILKFKEFPLGEILTGLLEIGREGMGCPVEIEFAVNFCDKDKPEFSLLQIRPMMVTQHKLNVTITDDERKDPLCCSDRAMGSSQETPVTDIVYVKPDAFDTSRTLEIAEAIGEMNSRLQQQGRKYLLIGPGRWGTSDRWLGIPVQWRHITQVATMIETTSEKLSADPSQGSHFFHNITSLGINYLGVSQKDGNIIDWGWLDNQPAAAETFFLRYIALDPPALLKINGRASQAVILKPDNTGLYPGPDFRPGTH